MYLNHLVSTRMRYVGGKFLPSHLLFWLGIDKSTQSCQLSLTFVSIDGISNIWAVTTFSPRTRLQEHTMPGVWIVLDQFFERTQGRIATFYDGKLGSPVGVVHLPCVTPFCPETWHNMIEASRKYVSNVYEPGKPRNAGGPYRHTSDSFVTIEAIVKFCANSWDFKYIGCNHVLASNACGALQEHTTPGDWIVLDQFFERTQGRIATFYDGKLNSPVRVVHLPCATPFCPETWHNMITDQVGI
uniref:PNP_UDP_1 domain-containing protein n=1 Tax=Schistocephalus solidus TaxID=70667 RepID=A0A183TE59_SCHSO